MRERSQPSDGGRGIGHHPGGASGQRRPRLMRPGRLHGASAQAYVKGGSRRSRCTSCSRITRTSTSVARWPSHTHASGTARRCFGSATCPTWPRKRALPLSIPIQKGATTWTRRLGCTPTLTKSATSSGKGQCRWTPARTRACPPSSAKSTTSSTSRCSGAPPSTRRAMVCGKTLNSRKSILI